MNCVRFANFMNNAAVIKTFNIGNSNITYIKTQPCQLLATITYRIMKFKPVIKKPIMINYTFFTVITFSNHQFLCLNQFYRNAAFMRPNLYQFQKNFHQDNQSLACLQCYKHNCLNILAGNICFCKQVKNQ